MKKTVELTDDQIELLLHVVDEEIEFTQQETAWDEAHPEFAMGPARRFTINELNEVRQSLSSV